MSKGILQVHPPICDCPGCRISSPVNRGRLADKRTTALPPTRAQKEELPPSLSASDGDSDGGGPAPWRPPAMKKETGLPTRGMKRRVHTHWDVNISFRGTSCSQDSDLSTLISSVHRSRHLVMPEHQSRCEFQRGGVELGLGATAGAPSSHPPAGDLVGKRHGRSPPAASDCPSEKKTRSKSPTETLLLPDPGPGMAPEDHYRRLVTALSEDPQRLYHLGPPSHDLQRVRQDTAATTARGPSGLDVHLPPLAAGHRRKQGLAQPRESAAPAAALSFPDRELTHPSPLLSPQNAPHIALGPHLRPPFLGVPSALCQTPGYGFLPPTQAEMFVRQQELLRKQNLARLEMSAELLRQKELERPQLLAPEPTLRPPDGAEELQRHRAMLVLRHSTTPLLALPPQSPPSPPQEAACRAPQKGGPGPAPAQPSESKETVGAGLWVQDGLEDQPPRDADGEDIESAAVGGQGPTPGQGPGGERAGTEKGHLSGSTLLPPLPLGLPYAVSPYFHTGATGALLEATDSSPEDVSKWTVDDVCSFVGGLAGCAEYATVFREQGIDGETLPLLTEEHLLTTMGLKLGPALKIRAQVARRLGRIFYMASFPVALPLQPPTLPAPGCELTAGEQPSSPAAVASPKQENGTAALLPGAMELPQPLC
ncbi:sterile alpha motif domain-containing protein 11 isoform X2 [Tamandua tetradactyla]|uniref:sterile alpha motif domain-containing protein 11 isoform X2 n=1 Tax=Tamandua tetradactyla TaxID=48850 RepID=UPI0040548340